MSLPSRVFPNFLETSVLWQSSDATKAKQRASAKNPVFIILLSSPKVLPTLNDKEVKGKPEFYRPMSSRFTSSPACIRRCLPIKTHCAHSVFVKLRRRKRKREGEETNIYFHMSTCLTGVDTLDSVLRSG